MCTQVIFVENYGMPLLFWRKVMYSLDIFTVTRFRRWICREWKRALEALFTVDKTRGSFFELAAVRETSATTSTNIKTYRSEHQCGKGHPGTPALGGSGQSAHLKLIESKSRRSSYAWLALLTVVNRPRAGRASRETRSVLYRCRTWRAGRAFCGSWLETECFGRAILEMYHCS